MLNKKQRAPVLLLYCQYRSWTAQELQDSKHHVSHMVESLQAAGHTVHAAEFSKDIHPAVRGYDPAEWIVFNWCEGIEGEVGGDARVCRELDQLGFTYTGNPSTALRLSIEKGRAKKLLQRWDIPTPAGCEFKQPNELASWDYFPAIVKPVSQHCSMGVDREAVVTDVDALRKRIAYINERFNESALVEQFIVGREINVGIWGNGRPRMLPLREIDFSRVDNPLHCLVTWDGKWSPQSTDWTSMPVVSDVQASSTLRAKIEEIVLRTYRAFDCRDYARIDMRVDANEQPFVVDVNPNPDITAEGGFIGACMAAGYTYGEAVSNIIQMAVARRNRRQALFNTLQQRRSSVVVATAMAASAG